MEQTLNDLIFAAMRNGFTVGCDCTRCNETLEVRGKVLLAIATLQSELSALKGELSERTEEFKLACRTVDNMETRDPDKRIAELEAALNELNSFDAPAELVAERQKVERLEAQVEELRAALKDLFAVFGLQPHYESDYTAIENAKAKTRAALAKGEAE